ncbi:cytochrome P450 [Roridomyces roridus]|uniref:Cytochrome P450 n=1 Tax=Roridomyces roridus TaxID=1738132 RepID=A0AAD7FNJ7_9AGAR|nr:cytochrome P450 [Roridomyces roridus]
MTLAKELLEKRSAKFSSRPTVPYSLCFDPEQIYWVSVSGQTNFIARKLTAGIMAGVRLGETELLQQFEALICANRLLEDRGRNWFREINRTSASLVLSAAFGLHCPTGDEPELKEVVDCVAEMVSLHTPSASIINALPFLETLIPRWIPTPWRTRAAAFRRREDALYDRLVERAVNGEAAGMNTWAAAFASEDKPEGDQRKLMNIFTSAAYETTASSLQSFVLACVLHPVCAQRAQAELDNVVGPDRLPTFKDRAALPYVEALVRETLRWRPAIRLGVPHRSTADDVLQYEGKEYFIPSGSIVFPLNWAIEHDSTKYEAEDTFNPGRFIDEDSGQLKPGYETSAFGFGRRACPGAPFAERSLWINIATLLWTFDIRRSDEVDPRTGKKWEYGAADGWYSGAITNAPLEFPAVFEPRSARHAEVVREEWDGSEKDLNVLLPQEGRARR